MSDYVGSGRKAYDEAKAKEANEAAKPKGYETSAVGLGALAAKLKAQKAEKAEATPVSRPTPRATPKIVSSPMDLGEKK